MRIEHPDIVSAVLNGYTGWVRRENPICPICRQECNYVFISKLDDEISGCDECLMRENADEYCGRE